MKISQNTKAFIIISIVACIAFWDVTTCRRTLKWDMIDGNYPFQYLQSEFEQHGEIPLWDSYTYYGNAMHAKMTQWYPPRFISSKISFYTLQKLNIEFVLHIILAGFGMFLLAVRFGIQHYISLIVGIAYMLSGFFVSNAQHMGWIVSGALLPLVLLLYHSLITKPSLKHTLLFALVFFSFISGGYPAFSIVICYVFFITFIVVVISKIKSHSIAQLKKILGYHLIVILPLIPLLGIIVSSHFDMVANVTRGGGISEEVALQGSLYPKHLVTFLLPFVTAFMKDFYWGVDPSMMNMYIGIPLFLFAILSLRFIRNKQIFFLWCITTFFILMSFGQTVPLRSFFYHYIPLFNIFRFPALFRLFFIMSILFLAAYTIQKLQDKITKRHIYVSLIIVTVVWSIVVIILRTSFVDLPAYQYAHAFIKKLSLSQLIGIQSVCNLLIVLIVAAFVFVYRNKSTIWMFSRAFTLLVVLDVLTATLLNTPVTVTTPCEPSFVQKRVSTLPKGFPTVNLAEPMCSQYDKKLALVSPLWRNNQVFYKKHAYNGYTSYVYKSIEEFEKSKIYDSLKVYPLAYIPQQIYDASDSNINFTNEAFAVFENLEQIHFEQGKAYSQIQADSTGPNSFAFTVNQKKARPLVLMQCLYPGWNVYVDNKKQDIIQANYFAMAVNLPAGTSSVCFKYEPKAVITFYYIYEYTLYVLIVLLVFLFTSNKPKKERAFIINLVILLCVAVELQAYTPDENPVSLYKEDAMFSKEYGPVLVDSLKTYGMMYEFKGDELEHLAETYNTLNIRIDVKPEGQLREAFVALSFNRGSFQFDFRVLKLSEFVSQDSTWYTAEKTFPFLLSNADNYKVKAFIYSPGKSRFYHKNFTCTFTNTYELY